MSQAKNLTNLPPELLLYIFKYVDSDSMVKLTETCTQFKDMIEDSDQLMNKITLFVEYPSDVDDFVAAMAKSIRTYKKIQIRRSSKHYETSVVPAEAFENVASTIQSLELNWGGHFVAKSTALAARLKSQNIYDITAYRPFHRLTLLRDIEIQADVINRIRSEIVKEFSHEFVAILGVFPSLQSLKLSEVHGLELLTNFEPLQNLSSIRELEIKRCDQNLCVKLLAPCTSLEVMQCEFLLTSFGSLHYQFVRFIASLENLKVLAMSNVRGVNFDLGGSAIKFQLNVLKLNEVYFTNQDNVEKFFMSQNQLKVIELDIKNLFPSNSQLANIVPHTNFSNILRIVFANNQSLESVTLHKDHCSIENVDFVRYMINPSVKSFSYSVTAEDKEVLLFKALSSNFPNLEVIEFISDGVVGAEIHSTCFENNRNFSECRAMTIINSTVHALPNINANNLEYFEYSPGHAGEFVDDYIGGFFHRHRGIKHLVLGTKTRSSLYFFVSLNLCQLIVNFLDKLETLTIYNFAEINKSVKCLCMHPNLRALTVDEKQFEKFTKSTKEACEKKLLKVIPKAIVHVPQFIDNPNNE